jgi:hypothetical protein
LALALLAPGVKTKALEGDVEGALADAKQTLSSVEGLNGKAAYVGGVVVVDAVAHLPVLGALLPGPAEFVGTAAATLLAAKYFVEKEPRPRRTSRVRRFAPRRRTLRGRHPQARGRVRQEAGRRRRRHPAGRPQAGAAARAELVRRPGRPGGTWRRRRRRSAPPCWRARSRTCPCWRWRSRARWSWSGVAYLLDAANRYGADESASLKDDLAAAAKKGGDAVKKLAGK